MQIVIDGTLVGYLQERLRSGHTTTATHKTRGQAIGGARSVRRRRLSRHAHSQVQIVSCTGKTIRFKDTWGHERTALPRDLLLLNRAENALNELDKRVVAGRASQIQEAIVQHDTDRGIARALAEAGQARATRPRAAGALDPPRRKARAPRGTASARVNCKRKKRCTGCNWELADGAKSCPACGATRPIHSAGASRRRAKKPMVPTDTCCVCGLSTKDADPNTAAGSVLRRPSRELRERVS